MSRVVSRLKERFEEWQSRELSDDNYAIVFLDGFHLKVRMAKRVVRVPVLAALGVAPDGEKQLLSLRPAASEASTHWGSLVEDLQDRGLPAPKLVVSDGRRSSTRSYPSLETMTGNLGQFEADWWRPRVGEQLAANRGHSRSGRWQAHSVLTSTRCFSQSSGSG